MARKNNSRIPPEIIRQVAEQCDLQLNRLLPDFILTRTMIDLLNQKSCGFSRYDDNTKSLYYLERDRLNGELCLFCLQRQTDELIGRQIEWTTIEKRLVYKRKRRNKKRKYRSLQQESA